MSGGPTIFPRTPVPGSTVVHAGASTVLLLLLLPGLQAHAQQPAPAPAHRVSRYIARSPLRYQSLIPAPPAAGTPEQAADLAEVHRLESSRTPAEIAAAQRDDREESIFAFATVLGPAFSEQNLPLTAALSLHLRQESAVVNPVLKAALRRPRPFLADPSLHPVCEQTTSDSYPSGHSMVGYLEAFALAQMLPGHASAILRRADDYARNRIVCGVHYPSDVAASHILAAALFATLAGSPRLRAELAAAKAEIQRTLPPNPLTQAPVGTHSVGPICMP